MSPPLPGHKLPPEVVIEDEEVIEELEVEIDQELEEEEEIEEEEGAEAVAHQDSMPMETQSRIESTSHSEESQERMLILMIENLEPEEEESLMTRRADTEGSTMEISHNILISKRTQLKAALRKRLSRRRFTRNQSQSQSQRWSNSLSHSMRSWLTRKFLEEKRQEQLKLSKDKKFKLETLKKSNRLFCKTNMPRTPLLLSPIPTMFILDSEPLLTMMMSHLEAEEEEVEEAVEAAMLVPVEEELGDKIQSKPSRRPKKISQHYERDGDPL